MKLSDIQQELTRLFSEQDAAEGGAIVVWHDPDGAFTDAVDELDLPDVEVLHEHENELFVLKRALNGDLSGRRILLYRPRARRLEGDWLADIEARSMSFAADYASLQLRELGAPDTPEMRAALAAHARPLKKKTVLRKLTKLCSSYEQPQQLACGLMAVTLGAEGVEPAALVRAYLLHAYAADGATAYAALEQANCAEEFTLAVRAWIGYTGDPTDFIALTQHLLCGALMANLGHDTVRLPIAATDMRPEQTALCLAITRSWMQSPEVDALFELAQLVEETSSVEHLLEGVPTQALLGADAFPCIDALIIRRLFAALAEGVDALDEAQGVIAARRTLAWRRTFAAFYEGLEAALNLRLYCQTYPEGIAPDTPEYLWHSYTSELYLVDTWYRRLYDALSRAVRHSVYGLDEDFRTCCASLEGVYKIRFVASLARRWEDATAASYAAQGYVDGIPRQVDFFMREVEPLVRSGKTACVIISDALRFEVAAELADVLEQSTKGVCALESMQAGFPSVTSVGMAALLPCGSLALTVDAGGHVRALADDTECASTRARQAQLQRTVPDAVAVTYEDFFSEMNRAERTDFTRNAQVVYVYHNTIDAQGDAPRTERKTFAACAEAIDELVALVQLVVREHLAQQVIITADHGFLYTDEPLALAEHTSAEDITGEVLACERRYAIAREGAVSNALMSVALPGAASAADARDAPGLVGFTPRACTRIQRPGAGENYVHGGISLQEICVPVLRFENKRAGSKGYTPVEHAALTLVTTVNVISNTLFNLQFLQEKPVGGKVLACEYELFVGDAARSPVTDIVHVAADRTQESAADRTIAASFSLKPGVRTSEQETYFLYARNTATGAVNVLQDGLKIRCAFAPSIDFGW